MVHVGGAGHDAAVAGNLTVGVKPMLVVVVVVVGGAGFAATVADVGRVGPVGGAAEVCYRHYRWCSCAVLLRMSFSRLL
jgi:hypothetical protein